MSAQATKEMTDIVVNNPEYIRNLNAYADAITKSMQALTSTFWQEVYPNMRLLAHDNLRLFKVDGNNIRIFNNPDVELLKDSASRFRIKSLRPKGYNYKFGLAYPIAEKDGQLLVAGIIIDSAVTFRVYSEDGNGYIPYAEVNGYYKRIREKLGDAAFPDNGWPEDLYICVKRPTSSEKWNFAEMNNAVLENLSNMESCIETILQEFKAYIDSLKEMLKEKK